LRPRTAGDGEEAIEENKMRCKSRERVQTKTAGMQEK